MRKQFLTTSLVLALVFLGSGLASAQGSDTATITYEVQTVTLLNMDTSSVTLTITTGTAGAGLTDVTSATTYDVTSNIASSKITGAINTAMPTGVTLSVSALAPSGSGGAAAGYVTLSGTAANLVTGMGTVDAADTTMTFKLSATAAAGVVAAAPKTFTMTVTAS